MIEALLVWPLGGALLAFLWRARGAPIGLVTAIGIAILALAGVSELRAAGPLQVTLGGWALPLGIRLRLDGLAALLLTTTAVVGLLLSLFAARFFGHGQERTPATPLFWPLWLLLWATLNGMFLAADLFTLYVLLEVSLLAAVALVTLAGHRTAMVAALRYLLAAMGGALLYLLGVAILYDQHGVLDLQLLADVVEPDWPTGAALLLMSTGLMLKAALFPLHFWLPAAHASAPGPVSAILSALEIKGAFYVLLRLWMELGPAGGSGPPLLLGLLAAAAMIWGSLLALRQRRLKLLIAYSTVAQVGAFSLVFPALGTAASGGWAGAAIQASAHGFAKAALFLAAGVVVFALGRDELAAMRGLARRLPLTVLAMLLAGLALYGTPGSGADLGKRLLVEGLGGGWQEGLVTLGGLLTVAYVIAMLRYTLLPARTALPPLQVSPTLQLIPLLLALAALCMGLLEGELVALLQLLDGGEAWR